MLNIINSEEIAKSKNPVSHAIKVNDLLFVSGQLGRNKEGKIPMEYDLEIKQAMDNLGVILGEAGTSFENVVKVNIYLTDLAKVDKFNDVYMKYFKFHTPARCCVEVSRLSQGANVEIELIAKA